MPPRDSIAGEPAVGGVQDFDRVLLVVGWSIVIVASVQPLICAGAASTSRQIVVDEAAAPQGSV